MKYIAAEDQKCNIGESNAMSGYLTCDSRTGTTVIIAAKNALADFKNPYSTSNAAVRLDTTHTEKNDMGFVNLKASGDTIKVATCYQSDCAAATNALKNTIEVGE